MQHQLHVAGGVPFSLVEPQILRTMCLDISVVHVDVVLVMIKRLGPYRDTPNVGRDDLVFGDVVQGLHTDEAKGAPDVVEELGEAVVNLALDVATGVPSTLR